MWKKQGIKKRTSEEWKEENSDPTELFDDVPNLVLLDVNFIDGGQLYKTKKQNKTHFLFKLKSFFN